MYTPARTLSISGLKSRVLKLSFFELKNDGKKCSRIYFEIHQAPSEIPAKLPGQFDHSGQIFLHWVAATLKYLEFPIHYVCLNDLKLFLGL